MSFQDWNQYQKQATRPTCNCGSNDLELVDVVLDNSQNSSGSITLPIWWCSKCQQCMGGRGYGVSQVISSNCVSSSNGINYGTAAPDVSQSMVPNYSVMYNEIQRIAKEMLNNSTDLQYQYGFGQAVNNAVAPALAAQSNTLINDLMQKVEQRLKEHLDEVTRIESDPLHEVRKRVAHFRLT